MKYCSVCKRHKCCGPAETRTVEVQFKCTGQPEVVVDGQPEVVVEPVMMIRTCKCHRLKECPFLWRWPFFSRVHPLRVRGVGNDRVLIRFEFDPVVCRTAGTETVTETETGVVQFMLSSRCDATTREISTSVK